MPEKKNLIFIMMSETQMFIKWLQETTFGILSGKAMVVCSPQHHASTITTPAEFDA